MGEGNTMDLTPLGRSQLGLPPLDENGREAVKVFASKA
jgi:hypothetical protein